jgi:hypothetical protein
VNKSDTIGATNDKNSHNLRFFIDTGGTSGEHRLHAIPKQTPYENCMSDWALGFVGSLRGWNSITLKEGFVACIPLLDVVPDRHNLPCEKFSIDTTGGSPDFKHVHLGFKVVFHDLLAIKHDKHNLIPSLDNYIMFPKVSCFYFWRKHNNGKISNHLQSR